MMKVMVIGLVVVDTDNNIVLFSVALIFMQKIVVDPESAIM